MKSPFSELKMSIPFIELCAGDIFRLKCHQVAIARLVGEGGGRERWPWLLSK